MDENPYKAPSPEATDPNRRRARKLLAAGLVLSSVAGAIGAAQAIAWAYLIARL